MEKIKRIWLISDLHFGVRSNNLEWLNIQKDYYYNWLIPILKEKHQEGDILFNLGDTFDNRQSINTLVMNTVLDIFSNISKILPIHIITGNHDIYRKSINDINSIKIFKYLPNIKIYQEPEFIKTNLGKTIFIMPWRKSLKDEIDSMKKNPADILFAHTSFQGAYWNKFIQSDEGPEVKYFKSYDKVYSGHIHYRQFKNNVTLVGCPYPLTRSDINNTKGIYLLDFTKSPHKEIFIENQYSPKFLKLKLEDILEKTLEEYISIVDNNFIDILCDIKWSLNFPFSTLLDLSDNYRKINIIVTSPDDFNLSEEGFTTQLSSFNITKLTNSYINKTPYTKKVKTLLKQRIENLHKRVLGDEE